MKRKKVSFYGTVVTRDYGQTLDGLLCHGVTGAISLEKDSDSIGFEVNERESNWFVRVDGKKETHFVPGCQVQKIIRHSKDVRTHAEFHRVP